MKKDYIFFGENGITDTVASRVADLSKASYLEIETSLNELTLVDVTVETINGTNPKVITKGKSDISNLPSLIERMSELKSLNAWLREAVKAHQNLINESYKLNADDYSNATGIKQPEVPVMEDVLTENDIFATFDIKKRNRYLMLETHAAVLGSLLHPSMPFDRARRDLLNAKSHPCTTTGSGTEMIIYNYTPSIGEAVVDDMYYKLQQEQAKYQSELNAMKSEIKSKITNDKIDKTKTYREKSESWNAEMKAFNANMSLWVSEEQKKIQKLKIVIPHELEAIYNEIAQLGK